MQVALLQDVQPVAYATKAFTISQHNQPQIEKEAFAIKYGCQKLHQYVQWKKLTILSDHKPLEIIFRRPIHGAPSRLHRILFDVLQYSPLISVYTKGMEIPLADVLSRNIEDKTVNHFYFPDFPINCVGAHSLAVWIFPFDYFPLALSKGYDFTLVIHK